jgi:Zn-dependent protease
MLSPGDLACPACGALVSGSRLTELSRQAQWLERQDPAAAAIVWHQCLELLPPHSPQAEMLRQRVALLEQYSPPPRRDWKSAVARTVGSMIISILVYGIFLGPAFAAGFVLLILVHEMGHVFALRYYGIRGSPPIFIPFVGAVITIPPMRDAQQEAIVGIGGPVLGTVGALVCFAISRQLHSELLLKVSFYGFAVNLLNMLPIPPLDGGRVTAAVSPWLWPVGLLGLIGLIAAGYAQSGSINPVMLLLLVVAAPRLWRTFRRRERLAAYYNIPKSASWAIGGAYLLLGIVLVAMFYYTQGLAGD